LLGKNVKNRSTNQILNWLAFSKSRPFEVNIVVN
jgi:hypothetical protein